MILAGAMADQLCRIERGATVGARRDRCSPRRRWSGEPVGEPPAARCLDELAAAGRPRRAAGRRPLAAPSPTSSTAGIELIEIGFDGGLRATASPGTGGEEATAQVSIVADACLVPPGPGRRDRRPGPRLVDDLARPPPAARPAARAAPLAVVGAPATARASALAAARAALGRPRRGDPRRPPSRRPISSIVGGGAFAVGAGPAVALAVADVLRRPGATPSPTTTPGCSARSA